MTGRLSRSDANVPGTTVDSPWEMPSTVWKSAAIEIWTSLGRDNISLAAAGVAFYGFVALVPMLAALVLGYGLVAAPATVVQDMQRMTSVMPADAARLIAEQLLSVVHTSSTKKGLGLAVAFVVARYGARNGASAIITGLDIAYEEKETRGFFELLALSLAITIGGILIAVLAMVAVASLGHFDDMLGGAPALVIVLGKLVSYSGLILGGACGAATLYRYGPNRRRARWVWITPGSMIAAILWLLLTLAFGLYVADFGNYNATYGSLGAVVVFLTWLYLSAYVLLLGAEVNAELERQTRADTTEGPPRPIGQRRATVADHVAEPADVEQSTRNGSGARIALDMTTGSMIVRGAPLIGLRRTGPLPILLATIGLSSLRREGRTGLGVALLGIGGAMAWIGRPRATSAAGKTTG